MLRGYPIIVKKVNHENILSNKEKMNYNNIINNITGASKPLFLSEIRDQWDFNYH